jgi:hypothetical protein
MNSRGYTSINDEDERSFITRKIQDGILVKAFIALIVLCLFGGGCVLGME